MQTRFAVRLLLFVAVVVPVVAGCAGGGDGVGSQAGAFTVDDGTDQTETATVVGRLVSLRTRAPVAGVRVAVGGVAAVSDAAGTFRAVGVPAGEHWFTIEDSRYAVLGGPVRIEVALGVNDLGQVVVDKVTGVPPAEPGL
jgi:hypothetical protein